jgi:Protein of unknown function (DUF1036)
MTRVSTPVSFAIVAALALPAVALSLPPNPPTPTPTAAPTPVPQLDSFLDVCDGTGGVVAPNSQIQVAIYRYEIPRKAWVSQGWYNFFAGGGCMRVNVGPNPGYVFLYAASTTPSIVWRDPASPPFCIDTSNRFNFVNSENDWNPSNCVGGTLKIVGGVRADFAPGQQIVRQNLLAPR